MNIYWLCYNLPRVIILGLIWIITRSVSVWYQMYQSWRTRLNYIQYSTMILNYEGTVFEKNIHTNFTNITNLFLLYILMAQYVECLLAWPIFYKSYKSYTFLHFRYLHTSHPTQPGPISTLWEPMGCFHYFAKHRIFSDKNCLTI